EAKRDFLWPPNELGTSFTEPYAAFGKRCPDGLSFRPDLRTASAIGYSGGQGSPVFGHRLHHPFEGHSQPITRKDFAGFGDTDEVDAAPVRTILAVDALLNASAVSLEQVFGEHLAA